MNDARAWMEAAIKGLSGALLAAFGFAMALGSCQGDVQSDDERWLGGCTSDASCARGRCLCGICTEVCSPDAPCDQGGGPTGCFRVNSPGLEQSCTGSSFGADDGVCLARCESDRDCPPGARCHAGACIPLGEADAAAESLPDPHDFGAVDAAADFASPVDLPAPQPDIEGDLSKLVGEWIQLNESGERCTIKAPAGSFGGNICMHLIIERGARGRFVGHAFWEHDGHNDPGATGPFAPATDPNVGYPVGVSPDKYFRLLSLAPGIDYRAFDGVFDGTRLSFWLSALDLWSGWCALQTPHLWDLGFVAGLPMCTAERRPLEYRPRGACALHVGAGRPEVSRQRRIRASVRLFRREQTI